MNLRGNLAALLAWLGLATSGALPTHACACARLPAAPARCCSLKTAPTTTEAPAPSCCCRPDEANSAPAPCCAAAAELEAPLAPDSCCAVAADEPAPPRPELPRLDLREKRVCCCAGLPPFETEPGAIATAGGERRSAAVESFEPAAFLPLCLLIPSARSSPRSEPPPAPFPLQRRLAVLCVLRL